MRLENVGNYVRWALVACRDGNLCRKAFIFYFETFFRLIMERLKNKFEEFSL